MNNTADHPGETAAGKKELVRSFYFIILSLAILLGAVLRLYMLPSQILLDDEWHGVNQVIGKSAVEVLTDFNTNDNTSPPLNIYTYILLHTVGVSEMLLRMPALLPGILALLLLPLLMGSLFNKRVTLIFAFLLAISPFLIDYSRFSRAYSLMMLLGFLSLLFAYRWFTTGRRLFAGWFLACATAAVYAHLFSVVAVIAAFGVAAVISGMRPSTVIAPPGGGYMLSGRSLLTVALIQFLLLSPILVHLLVAGSGLPWREGTITVGGVTTGATLLSGTVNLPLNILFFLLATAGFIVLHRRIPLITWLFAAAILAYVAALLVSSPMGAGTGVVLLRYMNVSVPICLLAVAVAIDTLMTRAQSIRRLPPVATGVAASCFLVLLFTEGPLPELYSTVNNFTGHSAFQGDYSPASRGRSEARHVYPAHSIDLSGVPEFYRRLAEAKEPGAIVEYPFDVCNYNNLFYYYQFVHGRRVIAGYCSESSYLDFIADIPRKEAGIPSTIGMLCADQILSRVRDGESLHLRNMVDVTDIPALKRTGADFIVLHKSVMALRIMPGRMGEVRVRYGSVAGIARLLREAFGRPVYEDAIILCFDLRQ